MRISRSMSSVILSVLLTAYGCKKTSSTDATAGADPQASTNDIGPTEATIDAKVTAATAELALPGALSIVPAQSADGAGLKLASDYSDDKTNASVRDASFRALDQARSIYCFTQQLDYLPMVNEGAYLANVDMMKCFDNEGDQNQSSSAGKGVVSYIPVTVESTRETEGPVVAKFWIPKQNIFARLVIAEGASTKNPIGIFTMHWNQGERGSGVLRTQSVTKDDKPTGQIQVILAQSPGTSTEDTEELLLNAVLDPDSNGEVATGVFNSEFTGSFDGTKQTQGYKVAFNSDVLLSKDTAGTAACLDRKNFDMLAWGYNLYTVADEKRVAINSGFPFEATIDGSKVRGFAGYFGVMTHGDNGQESIPEGTTIQRIDPKTGAKTPYTTFSANGMLIENTRQTISLSQIAGMPLNTTVCESGSCAQTQVTYTEAGGFKKIAYMSNQGGQGGGQGGQNLTDGGNGSQWTVLTTPTSFTLNSGANNFYSEGLGNVEIVVSNQESQTVSSVIITTTKNVTATAEDLTLYCLRDCPVASLTSTDPLEHSSWEWGQTYTLSDKITYTWDAATLSLKRGGTKVEIASGVDLSGSRYAYGMNSGAMIATAPTSLDDFQTATKFYTWTTGQKAFNTFTGIKDADGNVVTFDAPLQIAYTHAKENDADGRGESYFGKTFMIQYGGSQQLFGIPAAMSDRGYYQPLFSIASGTLLGDSNQYKIKITNGEQRMRVLDESKCSELSVASAPELPDLTAESKKFIDAETAPDATDLVIKVQDGESLLK